MKAFHESFVENLEVLKQRLLNSYTNKPGEINDAFISRFRKLN